MRASTIHIFCEDTIKATVKPNRYTPGEYSLTLDEPFTANSVGFLGIDREDLEGIAATITSYFEDCDRTAVEDDARRLAEAQRQAAKYMGEDGDGGNPDDRPEEA